MLKLILSLVLVSSSFAATSVGVVNIQKIITSVKAGKNIMKTLEKSYNAKKGKLKKEEDAIKKLQESYQKQSKLLSEKAKVKKEKEIREKMIAIQQKQMGYQKEMQKQELELKKPILEKLKGVIEQVSKNEKVSMTFEISASPLVYAEAKVDLTDKVIAAFDKKYKK